jgi:protein Mpv17
VNNHNLPIVVSDAESASNFEISTNLLHVPNEGNTVGLTGTVSIVLLTGLTILGYVGLANFAGLQPSATTITHQFEHFSSTVWDGYMSVLTSHPIGTKACTSGAVYAIGDIISQHTERTSSSSICGPGDDRKIDNVRVLRSAVAGFIGHGPLSHFWYITCDGFFEHVIHMTEWWSFLPKILFDQTLWGPIWNNSYILLIGMMRRDTTAKMISDVRTTTIPLVVSGLKLWPAAHIITYGLIPIENRLLWVDLVEILWVTILSSKAASLDDNNKVSQDQTT